MLTSYCIGSKRPTTLRYVQTKKQTKQKRYGTINIIRDHLHVNVPNVTGLQVEVCDLWTQSGLHLFVHLITRLHELDCQVHVVPREAVVGTKC